MDPADPAQPPDRSRERRSGRRRPRPAAERFDTTIASPCIAVCQIDEATGYCLGCFRSLDEIREWPIMSAPEKTDTLARIAERKAAAET